MEKFTDTKEDSYAILQIDTKNSSDRNAVLACFTPMKQLKDKGMEPDIGHYRPVYAGHLKKGAYDPERLPDLLESIFAEFNLYPPEDYRGRSLSVSDIIVLNLSGKISCHFVDSVGFCRLPDMDYLFPILSKLRECEENT